MLSNALTNAVTAPFARTFAAVKIELANTGSLITLCDGSGFVTFDTFDSNGNAVSTTFTANDPIYGTLSSVSAIPSAVLTSAPSTQVTLLPPSADGVAALNDPQNQLSQVYLYWGAVDEMTGNAIGNALVWSGNLDFVTTKISGPSRTVVLEVITGLDKFWPSDEAMRVNDQSHQTVWPGETGLSQVIASSVDPTWGATQATPIYPQLTLAPTVGDQEAGITKAGKSTGATFGPSGQGG
jgi:hypothetical protein